MAETFDTAKAITNLFLYGSIQKPDQLISDSLIRPDNSAISWSTHNVDAVSYMETGGGRFATGNQHAVVQDFFDPLIQISAGRYTISDLVSVFGLTSGFQGVSYRQWQIKDSVDDYAIRTYVFNSVSFRLNPDARFVVDTDGSRRIENYSLRPLADNFDFVSDDLFALIGNSQLRSWVDPSSIGRKVDILFSNETSIPTKTYRYEDYLADVNRYNSFTHLGLLDVANLNREMFRISNQLWVDGSTRSLDHHGRPIRYGTNNADFLDERSVREGPFLRDFVSNGIVLIGGDGGDTLVGSQLGDLLIGGNGNDVVIGNRGDDTILGGPGHDVVDFSRGASFLVRNLFRDPASFEINGIWYDGWRLVPIDVALGVDLIAEVEGIRLSRAGEVIRLTGSFQDLQSGTQLAFSDPEAGGSERDQLDFSQLSAGVRFSGGNSVQLASVSFSNFESFKGTEYTDLIDLREASYGLDLDGGSGADFMKGGRGADSISGGIGADYIIATAGDTVDGGAGNDYLEADGAGRVTYVFGRGSGHDVLGTPFWTYDPAAFSDRREDVVHLVGLTAADLELVWEFEEGDVSGDLDSPFLEPRWWGRSGDAALRITATGETLHLGALTAVFHNPDHPSPISGDVGYAVILDRGWWDDRPGLYQGSLPSWSGSLPIIGPFAAIRNYGEPTQHTPFMLDDGSRLSIMDLFDLRTLDPIEMDPIYVSAFEEFSAGAAGAAIVGTAGAPVAGTAGSDLIIAHVSGSVVSAGNGDDEVLGGRGWDSILGGNGADLLRGGAADDTLVGGAGNDTLDGEAGIDRLAGGIGDDLIRAGAGDVVVEAANQGIDTVVGVGGTARTLGANQEALILEATTLLTGTGNALANVIIGNASANTLSGLAGNDRLEGLDGADVLVGGAGSDTLDGGAGADRFRSVALADSTVAAPDLILGFRADATSSADRIDLRTLDADPVAAGDQAFVFIGAAAFNGTRGALRFDAVGGGEFLVSGDVDGDGAADFAIRVAAPSAPLAGWFLL